MRSYITIKMGFLFAAIAIGCGPGKELPDTRPQTKTVVSIPDDPAGKAPAASEPKAKEAADRALQAITNNNPALLAKAKTCVVTAKGSLLLDGRMVSCERLLQTVWPDRARATYTFADALLGKKTLGIHNHSGWMVVGTAPVVLPATDSEIARWTETDLYAQQWFILGLPFAETSAIFFDYRTGKTGPKDCTFIKIGLPNRPVYQVACEERTGLPVLIHYAPLELDQHKRLDKVVSLTEHELDSSGFRLPKQLAMKQNEVDIESWTIEKWQFPDKLEDELFESPKKR